MSWNAAEGVPYRMKSVTNSLITPNQIVKDSNPIFADAKIGTAPRKFGRPLSFAGCGGEELLSEVRTTSTALGWRITSRSAPPCR